MRGTDTVMQKLSRFLEKIRRQFLSLITLQKHGKGRVKQIGRTVFSAVVLAQLRDGLLNRAIGNRKAGGQVRRLNRIRERLRAPAAPDRVAALHCLKHRLANLVQIQGLFHIAYRLQTDGSLQILLVRVAAHKNKHGIRGRSVNAVHHLDTVHARHTHIGQHNIRMVRRSHAQSVCAVDRRVYLVNTQIHPVNRIHKTCTRQVFIINNQKFDTDTSFITCPAEMPPVST